MRRSVPCSPLMPSFGYNERMFRKAPPSIAAGKHVATGTAAERRFARAAVDIATMYGVTGRDGLRTARIGDLSGGGVRLETDEDLPAGTVVELQFSIPARTVTAHAHVVMSYFDAKTRRFAHGVAFTSIDPAAQEAIAGHVAALMRG